MSLTQAQLAALKADITADPAFAALPNTLSAATEIADIYSAVASPEFVVWKTSVDPDEIMRNGMDWTRVDNLSVGKARIWDWMTRLGTFDPSKANIRAGIDATWVGTAADLAVRAMVYTHCKRPASRIEKLYATGSGTTASPATMTLEGGIGQSDVYSARNLPE